MKRLIAGALFVIVVIAVFDGQAQRKAARKPSRRTIASKPKEKTEAVIQAHSLVDQFLTKCGDSYLGYINGIPSEWRGLHIDLRPETITQADTLNGTSYKATVIVSFDAEFQNGRWHEATNERAFCLTVKKENGVWQPSACAAFEVDAYGGVPPARKPNCAELPR